MDKLLSFLGILHSVPSWLIAGVVVAVVFGLARVFDVKSRRRSVTRSIEVKYSPPPPARPSPKPPPVAGAPPPPKRAKGPSPDWMEDSARPPARSAAPPPAPRATPPASTPSAEPPASASPPPASQSPRVQQHKLNRVRGDVMRASRPADATVVKVFYATDRLRELDSANDARYSSLRSPNGRLEYGECQVSIPAVHVAGQLESPSWLRFEFRPDPNKHIVLAKTTSLEEDRFFDRVKESILLSEKKDAFVFIHGYNVTFEDAARRTGQFAYDLKFIGAPIFYSWPSNGKIADYPKDETNVAWTIPHFQAFLTLLAERSGAERIHVIAHSMGNRAVCEALRLLSADPACAIQLSHLVLAAPDIDADTFAELSVLLRRRSTAITLYESRNDKALLASKKIHGYTRAGEPLLVVAGVDTVDASAIDTDFLGHSYFSSDYALLSDIHSMLSHDEPPEGRMGLSRNESASGSYYEFRPY